VKEIEANQFAANLLMPAWMISAYAPERSISDLANMFKVSHDAMSIRLKVLGYRLK
jgi:Zn-dependent peptidase ImmA (M78 family)